MKTLTEQRVKRIQKDYSLPFELAVVKEIGHGFISKTDAIQKFGIQSNATISHWWIQ